MIGDRYKTPATEGYVAPVTDTFGITLLSGIASGTDGDGVVDLSAAGAGEAVYTVQMNRVDEDDVRHRLPRGGLYY